MTHQVINYYLEEERKSHNMTIEKFVEGVFSERTYRRYINDGNEIPYQKLKKLLLKVSINPFGFLYSIQAQLVGEHPEELDLLMSLVNEDYEEANQIIKTRGEQPFLTFFGEYAIPLYMHMLDVYNKKTTLEKAEARILKQIQVEKVLNLKYVTHEPIMALNSFFHLLPDDVMQDVYRFVHKVVNKEYPYHFSIYRHALANLHSLYFKLTYYVFATQKEHIDAILKKTIENFHFYGLEMYMYDLMLFVARTNEAYRNTYRKQVLVKYLLPSIEILKNPESIRKQVPSHILAICEKEGQAYE